ncbi:8649_t:CDS:2, partial [Cetraspora pellucida]
RSVKQKLGSMEEYNEDDIDIATYFEETSCCSEDISNIYSNAETVSLRDGDSFKNFEEAEAHVRRFAKHKGFKHSGLFKPKDSARQSTSTRIMCPCHINLSCPLKDNPGFRIIVTTFNDNHNHDLSSKAIQFEKKQFTEKMRQEVEFLVTKCQLGATMYRLSNNVIKNDASHFYNQLLSKQQEDSC